MKLPKIGQYLYASCAGEDYGRILIVGKDANDQDVLDVELYDPQNLVLLNDDSEFPEAHGLTSIELPEGTVVIIRGLLWKWADEKEDMILCHTPGNGCYRCTKLFFLADERTKFEV